jgi:hypothetical protein
MSPSNKLKNGENGLESFMIMKVAFGEHTVY